MPLAGRQMLPREAYGYVYKAGWKAADKGHVAVAIFIAESRLYIGAYNDQNPDGSTDYGWPQINSVHKQFDSKRLLADPLYAAQCAYAIYKAAGYSFRPWAAYTNGRHKEHLPAALRGQLNFFREIYGLPIV